MSLSADHRRQDMQHRTILIVAAHPDDEVLGCGGTIARLKEEGHNVFTAILGEGITSRYNERTAADPSLLSALHGHSRHVSELLGVKDLFLFNLPDNRFDTIPLIDITKTVEGLIDKVKPEIVYTHHAGDLNMDHVITHRAVLTATRPMPGCPVKTLLAYEIPSATEWGFGQLVPIFRPNTFVDISSTIVKKIKAMEIYESELRLFPHPRSPEAIRAIAQVRGCAAGVFAAEAFELIRCIH